MLRRRFVEILCRRSLGRSSLTKVIKGERRKPQKMREEGGIYSCGRAAPLA